MHEEAVSKTICSVVNESFSAEDSGRNSCEERMSASGIHNADFLSVGNVSSATSTFLAASACGVAFGASSAPPRIRDAIDLRPDLSVRPERRKAYLLELRRANKQLRLFSVMKVNDFD